MRIVRERIRKALFLERPNRFILRCELEGEVLEAYLPNPGRLWELLFPGSSIVYLKRNGDNAKIPYTVMAVEKEGAPVMLHTHLTNDVVEMLLRKRLVPGLEDAGIVRREATFGDSRFDFLLEKGGQPFVLEVKNCTLFGETLAMFPDAVTQRGSRHLRGLLELSRKGISAGVLFAVQWPHARFFMPEYHTDFEFSRVFLECRDKLFVKALSLTWCEDLSFSGDVRDLVIPWDLTAEKVRDSGCYIVILRLENDAEIAIGGLGKVFFRKGWYLYAGSAKKALTKRIERHGRTRKNHFWHIDYLRAEASFHKGLAIRTMEEIECKLAGDLRRIADWSVKGFGSSDCGCDSHLFGMETDPVKSRPFIEMLYTYRIKKVEEELADAYH